MRRPRPLLVLLGLCALSSTAVMILGAAKLSEVDGALSDGVRSARSALISGETAVVSFVPGGGGVTLGIEYPASRAGAGSGVLIFHSSDDMEVAVFDGTDPATLERGAGRTVSTSPLNGSGRCVLHGHRDSAFKPLRTIKMGDFITVESPEGSVLYTVTDIFVTSPEDPSIYDSVDHAQLVLVTCYPFTFVGPAPDRCVVVAEVAKMQTR